MRIVIVDESIINHTIAKNVYSENGNLLLGKGVLITKNLLNSLIHHNIIYIYIDDEISKGIEPKGIINDQLMIKSVNTVRLALDKVLNKDKHSIRNIIPFENLEMVEDLISVLMAEIESSYNLLYTVNELVGTDMYTYKHSVNVAILSILTAKAMKFDYHTTRCIAIGAMLHDIGKIRIDNNLIFKTQALTNKELIELQSHSEKGYNLVKNEIVLSSYSKQIIRFHHEKLDGSGYPLGLLGDQIPNFVRLVTICDIFDAITSDKPYRKRIPIYEALEFLMAESVYKLDPEIYKKFVKNICVFPPGTEVLLSDKRKAIVVKYKKNSPTRPIVRIINPENISSNDFNFEEIDLDKQRTLFITSTIY